MTYSKHYTEETVISLMDVDGFSNPNFCKKPLVNFWQKNKARLKNANLISDPSKITNIYMINV